MGDITWDNSSPDRLLIERFQITTGFHPEQRAIIEQLVQGRRLLVIQRTGWGKSLCYQMACLYYPHLTVIFSPLKALMRDQCQRCNTVYAIPSAIVSSDFTEAENQATLERAIVGNLKLLYIAPERLSNALWQKHAPHMRISMIVIDEAHCISIWGHDFRPDYRRIVHLLNALPQNTPILALTATANTRVEEDILQQMGTGVDIIRGIMQRPNLRLHVVQLQGDKQKLAYLGEILPQLPAPGIIYAATQHHTEIIAQFLQQQSISAEYYHAGIENEARQEIEQKFMDNQYKVICATNALGMGIDKRDIRFIIHYQIPASPIHYYQEIGRAGRDGQTAWCTLLYDPEDLKIQNHFISSSRPDSEKYQMILNLLKFSIQGYTFNNIMRETGFTQTTIKKILADLQDQHLIEHNLKTSTYTALPRTDKIDFTSYDTILHQKRQELHDIEVYTQQTNCYMAYLTNYLGDRQWHDCGVCSRCQPTLFPQIDISKRTQVQADHFLEHNLLPHIEKRGGKQRIYEEGWSLSYHGTSQIGELVRLSKYEGAGPLPPVIVERTAKVILERYPVAQIDGIVSVPPTRSGPLVEIFAREVAQTIGIPYFSALTKIRATQEQKFLKNRVQKGDNIARAFAVPNPALVAGKTLLLIDDIYDSGHTLREVARTLRQAGAQTIYPFTITRTLHSDDQ